MEFCLGDLGRDGLERAPIGAGDEQAVTGGDDACGDGGDLFRRLARPENDLRTPLPERPMVIDAGEAKVLKRGLAQILKQLVLGDLRGEGPGANLAQDAQKLGAGHLPDCFDFGATPALI